MSRLFASLLTVLAMAGCATVSSGITPAGPDGVFAITERNSPFSGGARAAGREAMAQAQAFCQARNTIFLPIGGQELGRPVQQSLVGNTGFTLTFRCQTGDAPIGPDFEGR